MEIIGLAYPKSDVELRSQANEVQESAQVATPHTEHGAIWQFLDGVTISLPCHSETNMRDTNTAVHEEVGDTGEG